LHSPDTHAPTELEFVTFFSGGQSFSLDITKVREIRRWTSATPLPHAPAEVLGVMNLRGSVIPIYDLAARFGLEPTADNGRNVVVIAAHDNQTVGLLVSSVSEILSVAPGRIQDMPNLRGEAAQQNITGVILVGEEMTRVIDLGAIIQTSRKPAQ
jgi:purine-binding chemotaxis protein CheW